MTAKWGDVVRTSEHHQHWFSQLTVAFIKSWNSIVLLMLENLAYGRTYKEWKAYNYLNNKDILLRWSKAGRQINKGGFITETRALKS